MEYEPSNADEAIFLSKLAQQAGQYADMLVFISPIIEKTEDLTLDERSLVSAAFKSVLDKKRASWHAVSELENDADFDFVKDIITGYKRQLEDELKNTCQTAISTVDVSLFKKAETAESKVFFLKLKADYYRYMAEASMIPEEYEENSNKALEVYMSAKKIATEGLEPINPVRLGLALNFSVFFFEIKKNPKEACQIAKSALNEATAGLHTLEENSYKTSTYVVQMIKDNLAAWTSEVSEPESPG